MLFLLLYTQCSKEIEIDIPQNSARLVVNSLFSSDTIVKLNLSKSIFILDHGRPIVKNAQIKLYKDGVFLENLSFDSQKYISQTKPQRGSDYKITINVPEFPTLEAVNKVPEMPVLGQTQLERNIYVEDNMVKFSRLKLQIEDISNGQDYYEVFLLERYNGNLLMDVSYHKNQDAVINNEGLIDYRPSSIIFSDELFNSSSYQLSIDFHFFKEESDLIIILRSISKEYYLYQKYLTIHLHSQDDDFWNGLGEPAQVYSNIRNGYGIFAAYSEVRDTILNQ